MKYTFEIEKTFQLNLFIEIIASALYTGLTLLFIEAMYSNVTNIAGYTREEMLLFLFVGQIVFGLNVNLYVGNLNDMVASINNGQLDQVLAKPLPSLFYLTFRSISIVQLLTTTLPDLLVVGLVINWSTLNFTTLSLISGLIVMLMGIICTHFIQYLAALPAFFFGESRDFIDITWTFEYNLGRVIPFEGFSKTLKVILTTAFPIIISTGLSTSVFLGKTNAIPALLISLSIGILTLVLKKLLWNIAIKNYTSASS